MWRVSLFALFEYSLCCQIDMFHIVEEGPGEPGYASVHVLPRLRIIDAQSSP